MRLLYSFFFLAFLCVSLLPNLAIGADSAKYDCEKCDAEQSLDACFQPCISLLADHAKWQSCVDSCTQGKSRDNCLMTCYPVCEEMSGGPIPGANPDRGFANCSKCKGKVVLVR